MLTAVKFHPWVVGKPKKQCWFKNINMDTLPCIYSHHKKALIDGTSFCKWLLHFNSRMVAQNRHVLLTLGRCTAHNVHDLNLSNIKVQFFPSNATSRLQPLDQGIISLIKRAYRKRLGSALTELGDSNTEDVHELEDDTSPDEWTVLQDVVNPGISFEEFINVDNDVAICASVETDVPKAMNDVQEEPSEGSGDEENTDTIPPTCQEMFTDLDCLERFASTSDVTAGFTDAIIAIGCEITKYYCSHEFFKLGIEKALSAWKV
ncbi:tigger transposable element-derived protein 6-like [Schistocerca cancellata]|uniref:tigger transposable element-derived protein 6-like n=1 Tax=Schistocerca cancellata TaxID=274614 RepID=UPI002118AD63|nr:tigger transposable element-derived protein 6-like [Schistocerca cancellata]